jgi:hypothetical protein
VPFHFTFDYILINNFRSYGDVFIHLIIYPTHSMSVFPTRLAIFRPMVMGEIVSCNPEI